MHPRRLRVLLFVSALAVAAVAQPIDANAEYAVLLATNVAGGSVEDRTAPPDSPDMWPPVVPPAESISGIAAELETQAADLLAAFPQDAVVAANADSLDSAFASGGADEVPARYLRVDAATGAQTLETEAAYADRLREFTASTQARRASAEGFRLRQGQRQRRGRGRGRVEEPSEALRVNVSPGDLLSPQDGSQMSAAYGLTALPASACTATSSTTCSTCVSAGCKLLISSIPTGLGVQRQCVSSSTASLTTEEEKTHTLISDAAMCPSAPAVTDASSTVQGSPSTLVYKIISHTFPSPGAAPIVRHCSGFPCGSSGAVCTSAYCLYDFDLGRFANITYVIPCPSDKHNGPDFNGVDVSGIDAPYGITAARSYFVDVNFVATAHPNSTNPASGVAKSFAAIAPEKFLPNIVGSYPAFPTPAWTPLEIRGFPGADLPLYPASNLNISMGSNEPLGFSFVDNSYLLPVTTASGVLGGPAFPSPIVGASILGMVAATDRRARTTVLLVSPARLSLAALADTAVTSAAVNAADLVEDFVVSSGAYPPKSASPPGLVGGRPITVNFALRNQGTAPATGIAISLWLLRTESFHMNESLAISHPSANIRLCTVPAAQAVAGCATMASKERCLFSVSCTVNATGAFPPDATQWLVGASWTHTGQKLGHAASKTIISRSQPVVRCTNCLGSQYCSFPLASCENCVTTCGAACGSLDFSNGCPVVQCPPCSGGKVRAVASLNLRFPFLLLLSFRSATNRLCAAISACLTV